MCIILTLFSFIDNTNQNTHYLEFPIVNSYSNTMEKQQYIASQLSYNEFSIVSNIVNTTTTWIADYGYIGIFSAALLEYIFPPIPSELIFPLAGFTANTKNMGLFEGAIGMAIVGAIGSTIGATIIYYLSRRIGKPVILKLGKYISIGESELEKTEKWFDKYGHAAIFFGRIVPGLREIVSITAGIHKTQVSIFVIFTFAGSLVWCVFLTLVGYYLGEAWKIFYDNNSFIFDLISITVISAIIIGIVSRHYKKKRKKRGRREENHNDP